MVDLEELESALREDEAIRIRDGFICLTGFERLLPESRRRVSRDRVLNGSAWRIAQEYAFDLVRLCPFLDCVAVSGSLGSGGYDSVDDIDFDLFVRSGTKYTTYLLANLVGMKYSWRYRHRRLGAFHQTFWLPKVICINVVWPEDQTKPFVRQDADLAFELLRCTPLFGSVHFTDICRRNGWLLSHFPQISTKVFTDKVVPTDSRFRRLLMAIPRHAFLRKTVEVTSRGVVWVLYHLVQWSRRHDLPSVERIAFLQKAKWPYEVLQD